MADVVVKDSSSVQHLINTDTNPDGSETQVVKLQLGNAGEDGGLASFRNPLPTEESGLTRLLFKIFGRFSFGISSALRTEISNTPAVTVSSGTVTVGFGDAGKSSTIQQTSAMMFYGTVGANFIRS